MKKRTLKRIIGWSVATPILLTFILFLLLNWLTPWLFNDTETRKMLAQEQIPIIDQYFDHEGKQVHLMLIGDTTKPKVLLIHGSPGSWVDFKSVIKDANLRSQVCFLAYDRAGYAETELPAEADLAKQALLAKEVANRAAKAKPVIAMGYSYGGAVLSQLLIDAPSVVDFAIYAAPCLDPNLQQPKWYNQVADLSVVNYFLADVWKVCNHEMLGLQAALPKVSTDMSNIKIPTIFIHGKKDWIVPFKTVAYYQSKNIENVDYWIRDEMGHEIPWAHADLMINAISQALYRINQKS